jgi:phosphatidate cytidylyltransferase
MLTRILAAAVGLGIVVPTLIFGGTIAAEILVGIVLIIGLDEYVRMSCPGDRRRGWLALGPVGVGLYLSILYGAPASVGGVALLGALWIQAVVLFRPGPVAGEGASPLSAADMVSRLVFGAVYVAALVAAIPLVRRFEHGVAWIFLLLVVTWAGDSGAYFAGRAFGKNKLYEKISPKKTREGAAGGLVASVAGALIVRQIGLPDLGLVACILLGAVLDVAGVIGDLAESMLKRSFGVKDSGSIMPGHGGILDRIDSLLFSAPLLWVYLVSTSG